MKKPINIEVARAWLDVSREACGIGKATQRQRDLVCKAMDDGNGELGPVHGMSQAFLKAAKKE